MQSSQQTLSDLFSRHRHYRVPLFQRPYVWGEDDRNLLWQDIARQAVEALESGASNPQKGHFLGAVVLRQIRVSGRHVDTTEIIDGQQRFTTLQLLLAAFRGALASLEDTDCELGRNDLDPLILNDCPTGSPEEKYKVWPTNVDREYYADAMEASSVEELEEKHPQQQEAAQQNVLQTYLFFGRAIREFLGPAAELEGAEGFDLSQKANALYSVLRHNMRLIVVDLDEEDDPQVIFETLNARGVPLRPSDLIRNFVFLSAKKEQTSVDQLYSEWWEEYDTKLDEDSPAGAKELFWKKEERQGRITRTRLDLFIHHFVQCQTREHSGIEHLYKNFRGWWESDSERDVAQKLQELRSHSDVFAKLLVPPGDEPLSIFASRLKALDTGTIYPVLLTLLVSSHHKVRPGDLSGILRDLESYLVRRMVCNLGTRNYNRFFISMLQELHKSEQITRGLVQSILLAPKGTAGEWPDDRKFARAWLEEPVYSFMKPARRCAMVLSALNARLIDMLGNKQEGVSITGELTIEHVLPQDWKPEEWPLPADLPDSEESAEEQRNRLLHSFGNLTLITGPLNSSVGNGPYTQKRDAILEHSLLPLNHYFRDASTWGEAEIQERGRALLDIAKVLWPRPDESTA